MAAGLISSLFGWFGRLGAGGGASEGNSTLCIGSVRTYPALSATASVHPALIADASVYPALSATARAYPALDADAFVYPALAAQAVTVGCEKPPKHRPTH